MFADLDYRYRTVGRMLTSRVTVLEVGGFVDGRRGYFRRRYLGDAIAVNRHLSDRHRPSVVSNAADLAFADRSFDTVVLIDVIEHVPPSARARVVREAVRVCRDQVIVMYPFDSAANTRAENLLTISAAARGVSKESLVEHRTLGLPSARCPGVDRTGEFIVTTQWRSSRVVLFASMKLQLRFRSRLAQRFVARAANWILLLSDATGLTTEQGSYRVVHTIRRAEA